LADRTKQQLKVYQDDELIAISDVGKTSVHADLPEGDYPAGTFKESFYDTEDKTESNKVDVPSALTLHFPGTPQVSLEAGDGKVTATYAKIAGATGYEIWEKKASEDWPTTPFKTVDDDTLSVDVTGLTNGTEYTVAVVAVNAYGKSDIEGEGASGHVTPMAPTVDVTGVTLTTDTPLNLKVGDTHQISANIEPDDATDKALTYDSADDTLATVDDKGNITAVKDGEVDVVVASHADPTKKATLHLVISAAS
jgi:hypothetical protein